MAHTLGGMFHVAHGLADAILLPYIIRYNSTDAKAKEVYDTFAKKVGAENLYEAVEKLDEMAALAKADGCTKTNPIIPELEEFKELFMKAYRGE